MLFSAEIQSLDEVKLCRECARIVVDFFNNYGYDFSKDESILSTCTPDSTESILCECCSKDIGSTIHFMLSIPEGIQLKVADVLSEDIGGCEFCEGNERANYVHAFNSDPFDKDSRIDYESVRGDNATLYVGEQNVPDELNTLFVKLIVCPCGRGRDHMHPRHNPDGGIFEPHDDIYTQKEVWERDWGFDIEEFSEFGKRYGESFTQYDLIAFRKHLLNYPMLALRHGTGQAIYKALEKHFHAKDFAVLNQGDAKLYRGRTRKKEDATLTKDQMWAPPLGKPQHGRYNSVGVPVIYVSDTMDAIPYEIHPSNEDAIDIAQIELLTDSLSIFDLNSFDFDFQGFFNEKNEESSLLKSAYLLPNFIGTCCSSIGYNGVKYRSVHTKSNDYLNYALFNVMPKLDLSIVSIKSYIPEILYKLEHESAKLKKETLLF